MRIRNLSLGIVIFVVWFVVSRSSPIGAVSCPTCVSACGPLAGTDGRIKSTTYYFCNPDMGYHGAEDVINGGGGYCGCDGNQSAWHRAQTLTLQYHTYNAGYLDICPKNCDGSPASCTATTDENCHNGYGNYFTVFGSNGYSFNQLHMNHSATYSYTKYAKSGDILGHWGSTGFSTAAHGHADNRQYGTLRTEWYTAYINNSITCGSRANVSDLVGYPQLG
jgi:hypothetical protein